MLTADPEPAGTRFRGVTTRRVLLALGAAVALGPLTGSLYTSVGAVALTALILFTRRRHDGPSLRKPSVGWRLVPLAGALVMLPLLIVTWGAAILLAPVTVALTIMTLRKLPMRSDPIVLVGTLANGYLAFEFLIALATIAYDGLT